MLEEQNTPHFETVFIKDTISRCEDINDLKEQVFPLIRSQQAEWKDKINQILEENHFTKTKFASMCGVSRVTVDKWCKGIIPKNREMFIRIGMISGYNYEQMNTFLKRYGKYPELYAKSLEDCVCIFVLKHNYGDLAIEKYQYILGRIKTMISQPDEQATMTIQTNLLDEQLDSLQSEAELEEFILQNTSVFSQAYKAFYAYVKMNLQANYMQPHYAQNIYEMSEIQGWSSSLRQCVSAIRQNKWYPTRKKIISLGLHLSMDHEQIDEMLSLAHMEPLCAKNIFESVIMFILDDASLNDILNTEADTYDPDELFNYTRQILIDLDIEEFQDFISELTEAYDE